MLTIGTTTVARHAAKFLYGSGFFLPETFRPANLHPVTKGWEVWGGAVKDKLAELVK